MSKYIKLDDAIGIITEHQGIRGDTFKALHNAHAVDIVRCKECKWADKCSQNVAMRDTYKMYEGLDFCSYGVRKTNTTAEEKPTPIRDYMVHGEREGE